MDIKSKLDRISELAPLPTIAQQLTAITSDPDSSSRDIAALIKKDQILTATLLKVVNSAYYGFSRRIGNIDHAIVLLGFNEVTSITLALCLIRYYPIEQSRHFSREQFWNHALGAAYVARSLSSFRPEFNVEDAYVSGLLHDFGKVVMDQLFPDEFRRCLEVAAEQQRPLQQVSDELIGINHAEVGALVAEAWRLPEHLIAAIRYHHQPFEATHSEYFVHLAHIANFLCHRQRVGSSGNPVPDQPFDMSLEALRIKDVDLDRLWESLRVDARSIRLYL